GAGGRADSGGSLTSISGATPDGRTLTTVAPGAGAAAGALTASRRAALARVCPWTAGAAFWMTAGASKMYSLESADCDAFGDRPSQRIRVFGVRACPVAATLG